MPWLFPHCSWRSASRLVILWRALRPSVLHRHPQCAPLCLGTAAGLGHHQFVQQSQRHPYQMFWFIQCTFEVYGTFPTDWEGDFPAQLTQCSPEVCDTAFSSPILLWKQLSIITHCLTSACSWWGRANIKSTRWQSQADAVSLCYWMQFIRNFSFSLWRYSAAPPQHSRLKRNLEFISKTTSNFLTARESICKWKLLNWTSCTPPGTFSLQQFVAGEKTLFFF